MIRSVHFESFRCLRGVELALEPLTVLVGPSSSGKTAVLDGLGHQRVYERTDFWGLDESRPVAVEWRYVHGDWSRLVYPYSEMDSLPVQGHSTQGLVLEPKAVRAAGPALPATWLERDGSNLAGVFAALPAPRRAAISRELCRRVPAVSDVEVRREDSERYRLCFRDAWKPGVRLGPETVADGVLVLLALLVLPHQRPLPDLLTLDEPERALHPSLLREAMALLRAMTRGDTPEGRPVQVVLATHSAEVLEYVSPEEVRLLARSPENGGVRVSGFAGNAPDWRRACREHLDAR